MSTNSMLRLEAALATALRDIRQRLQRCEKMAAFELTISAEGRIHEGEIRITYALGNYYGSANAKGGRLEPVVAEYARRHGWVEANAPTCLTFSETPAETE